MSLRALVLCIAGVVSVGAVPNCSGKLPPFSAPSKPLTVKDDWHYPIEEHSEAAKLMVPMLVDVLNTTTVVLRSVDSNSTATLVLGSSVWGWRLELVSKSNGKGANAVLEYPFKRWAAIAFLRTGASSPRALLRKPVGEITALQQPRYQLNTTDHDWYCKQDVDAHDWIGEIATNLSSGEATFEAALSVMAPNPDHALFGNPEELNKWILTAQGDVWAPRFALGNSKAPEQVAFSLSSHLPSACLLKKGHSYEHYKGGLVGRYLRVANVGIWDSAMNCGAEIMAVGQAGATASAAKSTAFLALRVVSPESPAATTYFRMQVDQKNATLLALDALGTDGESFYAALLAQVDRWGPYMAAGAVPQLPWEEQRYVDMPKALMTAYMNLDRGLTPIYGAGKFWNEHNEGLPTATLALNEALLEWGQHVSALQYLGFFFGNNVNASTGLIKFGAFPCCDSFADYGRLLSTFVKAVRYSGNLDWARTYIPVIEKMAGVILALRFDAVTAYPKGHPLHGIIASSPESDFRQDTSYFFSVNVWSVRGLLELHELLTEMPALSHNASLEEVLSPTALSWRDDIQFAANFTAVRSKDGSVFFLHPCVGSNCAKVPSKHEHVVNEGGDESTCVERGTCFAGLATGRHEQLPNYANFRFFSETLLAGVLDKEYELGIMTWRESHNGTVAGMTRFREKLDDYPILGYGRGDLSHDRLASFHLLLAGHSANYMSRGTFWGTEQRKQNTIIEDRWRNVEAGGEDGSLCMVSSIAPAIWLRWALVDDSPWTTDLFIARGAPRRWYQRFEPFGISAAPTRFGAVTYSIQRTSVSQLVGAVNLLRSAGMKVLRPSDLRFAVHIRSPTASQGAPKFVVEQAVLDAWHAENETAIFRSDQLSFNFTVTFAKSVTFV